jgi:pSer/pThr/pTyr-binding forkhead associated (FHA) protein
MLWNGRWVVQDLDSTNGTFLAGERVSVPTPVPTGATVTIGQTSFELRR